MADCGTRPTLRLTVQPYSAASKRRLSRTCGDTKCRVAVGMKIRDARRFGSLFRMHGVESAFMGVLAGSGWDGVLVLPNIFNAF
jgi:hypothetical protein